MKLQAFVSANILGAALLVAATPAAVAQPAQVFRAVQIDMSGVPSGAFETRRQLQACLVRAMPAALGGRLQSGARGAPVLIVRPTSVWLTSQVPASTLDDRNGGIGSNGADVLEGEAIIGNQRIMVSAAANGDFGAAGLSEAGARLRTEQLCNNFALWVARKV